MKDGHPKIKFQILRDDSGRKLTVSKDLGCGAILRTRGEGVNNARRGNETEELAVTEVK